MVCALTITKGTVINEEDEYYQCEDQFWTADEENEDEDYEDYAFADYDCEYGLFGDE